MIQISIPEAEAMFTEIIHFLEANQTETVTLTRNGKPVVCMTLIQEVPALKRIGLWKGQYTAYQDKMFDADDETSPMMLG